MAYALKKPWDLTCISTNFQFLNKFLEPNEFVGL